MLKIGVDRIGVKESRSNGTPDECPEHRARGVFRNAALVCPKCGRILGGI